MKKILKVRWITTLLLVVGVVVFLVSRVVIAAVSRLQRTWIYSIPS